MAVRVEGIDSVAEEGSTTADKDGSGEQFLFTGRVSGSACSGELRSLGSSEQNDE
jgi:hypothetical protein